MTLWSLFLFMSLLGFVMLAFVVGQISTKNFITTKSKTLMSNAFFCSLSSRASALLSRFIEPPPPVFRPTTTVYPTTIYRPSPVTSPPCPSPDLKAQDITTTLLSVRGLKREKTPPKNPYAFMEEFSI